MKATERLDRPTRSRAWIAGGLALATLVLFLPALANGFVSVDDGTYVWRNPDMLRGLGAGSLRWALTTQDFPTWHPLTLVSHLVDVSLFGARPLGHHLTSVLLHSGTVALVFLALAQATARLGRSAAAAALFGIHPLRVESVAWVAERKDVLCGFFCAAALLLYVRYRQRPTGPRAAAVTVALVLALLAKPMAVTLPFVFLLMDAWPLGKGESWRARLTEKLPWLGCAAVTSAATVAFQRHAGAVQSLAQLPLHERLASVPVAYVKALALTFWPLDLSFHYLRRTPSMAQLLLAVTALGAIAALAWAWRRERPSLWVGLAWFAGMMVPTVGLVQVGAQLTADRYTYFPHVGLFAGLVFALPELRTHAQRVPAAILAGLIGLLLMVRTVSQIRVWRSSESLFAHALELDPENDWVLVSQGLLRREAKRLPEAAADLRRALQLRPGDPFTEGSLAEVLLEQGQLLDARKLAEHAAQDAPGDSVVRAVLGRILLASGFPQEAVSEFRVAMRLNPSDPELHKALITALGNSGDDAAALHEASAGLERWPDDLDLRFNAAMALARLNRLPEADAFLQELLARASTYPGAREMLAKVREDEQAP